MSYSFRNPRIALLFVILAVLMSIFGDPRTIDGLKLGILIVLPLVNIAYLIFIHITQPEI